MATTTAWWRRTFDFEAQCWIAWSGLLAFGLSGLLQWRTVGAYPALEGGAVVLAGCWAIDLVRTGRTLRRQRKDAPRETAAGAEGLSARA